MGRFAGRRRGAARALSHVVDAQKLDAGDADGYLLEARALLALPRPSPAQLARAQAALAKALARNPRMGRAWLEDARARRALGDLAGARASVDRAATSQPRLAEIVELRRALAP